MHHCLPIAVLLDMPIHRVETLFQPLLNAAQLTLFTHAHTSSKTFLLLVLLVHQTR